MELQADLYDFKLRSRYLLRPKLVREDLVLFWIGGKKTLLLKAGTPYGLTLSVPLCRALSSRGYYELGLIPLSCCGLNEGLPDVHQPPRLLLRTSDTFHKAYGFGSSIRIPGDVDRLELTVQHRRGLCDTCSTCIGLQLSISYHGMDQGCAAKLIPFNFDWN
jgi:hypothetical protein